VQTQHNVKGGASFATLPTEIISLRSLSMARRRRQHRTVAVIAFGRDGSPEVAARSDCAEIWSRGRWITRHLKPGQKPHIALVPPSGDTTFADGPVPDFDFLAGGDIYAGFDEPQWQNFYDYIG
jgi:hypothetical protein